MHRLLALCLLVVPAFAADKYTGPIPPKADVPYLLHADKLIPTDAAEAREENRKDTTYAIVPGAAAAAKTPIAEPIFIMKTEKLSAERLAAFKMEVKNGNREVLIGGKKSKKMGPPIYLNVTRLADNLYKIEVDQVLENGQYTLSPEGSNEVFSFEVY